MVPEYNWLFWKRVLDIVCVFTITCIQLPYPHCVPRGVHRVWMSLFCVKDIVCFHVLVNDLVMRVSSTDTGAIPCICTSGSVGRGAMHWIGWKRFKQPGHAYMIRGMHNSALWYMCYDYMHVWYCFYVQLYAIILYVLYFVKNGEKKINRIDLAYSENIRKYWSLMK